MKSTTELIDLYLESSKIHKADCECIMCFIKMYITCIHGAYLIGECIICPK